MASTSQRPTATRTADTGEVLDVRLCQGSATPPAAGYIHTFLRADLATSPRRTSSK